MEKGISYLNRTFDDYKNALKDFSRKYYPDMATEYGDASVGSWLIDINADVADNLSYHIDRVYQETNIDSAQEPSSVMNIARNNGVKVPGPKGAMAEVRFTCQVPVAGDTYAKEYLPVIKRGTMVNSSSQMFEVMYDINFSEQYDEFMRSDRTIEPVLDANGNITKYNITKLAVVTAGETRIFKKSIKSSDIRPFMEIIIPVEGVMNVESILMKDGDTLTSYPSYGEFYSPKEIVNEASEEKNCPGLIRFFEVDSLAEQLRWGETLNDENCPVIHAYGYFNSSNNTVYPTCQVTKGEWKPVSHKFITEYTDNGYMKVIFGAGVKSAQYPNIDNMSSLSKHLITRTIRNNSLGELPNPGTTIFILYRVGGGSASNVAQGAISSISKLLTNFPMGAKANEATKAAVRNSIRVINTTPSVSGKDMPTVQEMKYLIKYNKGAQNRCVTTKDYIDRVLMMPPKYGTPFRVGCAEDNNKIMLYLLGIDYQQKLDAALPSLLTENIQNYLTEYRMINDFVEIKPGRIINLSVEVDVHVDKNYNMSDVVSLIIAKVRDYFDINKRNMGDDLYVGDLKKEISKIDGVANLIDLRVYNETCDGYSSTQTNQELYMAGDCNRQQEEKVPGRYRIDLEASDGIIYSDGDTMLEIKWPEKDIRVFPKEAK
jgi:hypothetical protein